MSYVFEKDSTCLKFCLRESMKLTLAKGFEVSFLNVTSGSISGTEGLDFPN